MCVFPLSSLRQSQCMVAATSNMVQREWLEDLSVDSSHLASTLAGEYTGQEHTCTQRDSFFFRVSEPPNGHSGK